MAEPIQSPTATPVQEISIATATPTAAEPTRLPSATSTQEIPSTSTAAPTPAGNIPVADVISVRVGGDPGAYQFSVEISSPDLGCQQYADWWEVVDERGELVYRRILQHSHVNEQPFIRSGGPVPVEMNETVIIRAHMHPSGYGGASFKGSVEAGFQPYELEVGFATELEETTPLPASCAF